jgi:hypothetical protein
LTDAKGFFQIPCLPPGNYRVKCSVEKHRDIERSIELTAGIVSELQLVAERLAEQELVHVEGLVESDTGGYRGRLYALALPERTRKVVRSDVTWATVSGRAVGSFAFDLAPGEHSISLSGNRLLEVEPREVAWAAAGAPLEFRVHDAVELGRLQFHAVDPAGGEVPLFRVRVTIDGKHGPLSDEVVSTLDLASMDDVPVGVPCRYRASAEERQSAWGTCSASQSSSPPIEVPLPKGWSTEVFVTDDRGQPLSGVRVVFDGELRGVTATDAPLRVALDHVPQSVFFELDGWKIVERGDYSAETGRFRSWQPFLTMRMEKR